MAAEMRGDLSADEEARLLRSIAGRERANEALHAANLAQSERAADFEQALEQLKLATGATTLREVVDKVAAQAGTRVSLDREKTQAEARLVAARQDKDAALRALNELKASGLGGMELSRDVCNALEAEIHQAKATLKVNSAAFERLDGVLSAVRQGAFGLAQRLQAFDDALDTAATPNAGSMPNDGSIMMKQPSLLLLKQHRGGERPSVALAMAAGIGGTTMGLRGESAECLALAEAKLTRILELVGQPSGASVGGFGYGADGSDGAASSGDPALDEATGATARLELLDERNALWSPATNNDPVVHANNIRVRPDGRPARHRGVALPPPVREDFDPLDSARSDTTASNGGSANDHVDHGRLGDALVPSRIILKMSSSRHCAEVFRKKEVRDSQPLSWVSSGRLKTDVVVVAVGREGASSCREGRLGRGDDRQAAKAQPTGGGHPARDVAHASFRHGPVVRAQQERTGSGGESQGCARGASRRHWLVLGVRDAAELPGPVKW